MKRKIAHIINPFIAPAGSDLVYAQPITFETLKLAKEKAAQIIEVDLLAACFAEDEEMVPSFIKKTSFLQHSVLEFHSFNTPIKLPLISEILEKAFTENDADYIIYSNVDIGLYPDFYLRLNTLLDQGYNALIINRKRIAPRFTAVSDLDEIFKQDGKSHPGFDCFVFHRSLYKLLQLENICIGVPFIEITFSQNLFHLASPFKLVETDNYTFHIGMEIFKHRAPKEYVNYNRTEFRKVIKKLDPILTIKNFPFADLIFPFRVLKWGLHPCIPITLALKLQWRQWFKK